MFLKISFPRFSHLCCNQSLAFYADMVNLDQLVLHRVFLPPAQLFREKTSNDLSFSGPGFLTAIRVKGTHKRWPQPVSEGLKGSSHIRCAAQQRAAQHRIPYVWTVRNASFTPISQPSLHWLSPWTPASSSIAHPLTPQLFSFSPYDITNTGCGLLLQM